MSERGVFAVHRGVFDHPLFAPEPYTEREAWLWMCGAAAWKPTRIRAGRHVVKLKRGECAFALRFMATKWKWSEPRVRRFLKRLEIDAMVLVSATHETTRITICNYDKYAFGRRTDDAQTDAPTDAPATHPRRKEEESKNLRTKEEDIRAVAPATRPSSSEDFEKFWKAYPRRDGANPKAPAFKVFTAAVKSGADTQAIIGGAERYQKIARAKGQENTQYVAQAVTWLRQSRWADYPASMPIDGLLSDEERTRLWAELHKGGPGERAN